MELVPVGDPADGAGDGEDHGEHVHRDADRLHDDAGVEVHVRVELLVDEVGVGECNALQLHGDVEQRILDLQLLEHLVAGLAHHLGTGVVVLVDPVTEAHQTERVVLVLGAGDVFGDAIHRADLLQHAQAGLVGTTVSRAPQGGDTGGDTGKRVGTGGASQTNGRGRGILLVISVQGEDAIHGALDHRVDLVLFGRHRKHHVQEVAGVGEGVARLHERLADGVLEAHGGQGRHLGEQAEGADLAMLFVIDIEGVVIESREGTHHATHDGHGVGVTTEAAEEEGDLLVHHGVTGYGALEFGELGLGRRLAVEQDVADFEVVGLFGQLGDGVTTVQQDTLIPVDIGNGGLARTGRHEARVKGEIPLCTQFSDINDIRSDCSGEDRQFNRIFPGQV